MPLPPTFFARLRSARPLTSTVRELVFEREDGPLLFDPGQWVSLALQVGPERDQVLRRSYSIASPPDGTGRFEIAVTRVPDGPGSGALHAMQPGDRVQASGPQGFFGRPAGVPSLFVGTGTGVTPLRSMLRAALAAGASEPMVVLLGVRRPADILYRDEFEDLERRHTNLRFHVSLSQPEEGWVGRQGYVQLHAAELWARLAASSPSPPHLFVCGLDRMVKVVRDLMRKQLGVPREQIHSERFD